MAAPIVQMDGKLIPRASIAFIHALDPDFNGVKVVTTDGTLHVKTYGTFDMAQQAYAILKNLTEIDDLDGL